METIFKKQIVTRQDILNALGEFSDLYPEIESYDDWLEKKTYKFAVRFGDQIFPPKIILSMATGIPTTEFSGGDQTNRVFVQLGFDVEDK